MVTTDQCRQFESEIFKTLTTTFGIQHLRTSLYHSQANSMVERLHRTLKTALTAQETTLWTVILPIVFLALCNTVKTDIGHMPTEMVYGMSLRLPGEIFHPAPAEPQTSLKLVRVLRISMAQLQPTTGTNHATRRSIFVPYDLNQVSHATTTTVTIRRPVCSIRTKSQGFQNSTAEQFIVCIH